MRRVGRLSIVLVALWGVWFAACYGRYDGRTPLMEAARLGLWPVTRSLLLVGASANDQSIRFQNGWTPLAFAAQAGDLRSVRALLNADADPNWGGWRNTPWPPGKGRAPQPEEIRPLCLAVSSPYATTEIVEVLIAHGAELQSRDGGFTALGCYAAGPDRAAKVQALIGHGADANAALNGSSEPLLIVYAKAGYTDVVQRLLDGGADIEARGTNGNDAWTEALVNHRKETADLLLARRGGEDRNAR